MSLLAPAGRNPSGDLACSADPMGKAVEAQIRGSREPCGSWESPKVIYSEFEANLQLLKLCEILWLLVSLPPSIMCTVALA
eukprot:scaffold636385_cov45-Prasinocladus_malaysianus.AAC.1